jgi:hypothetical protein
MVTLLDFRFPNLAEASPARNSRRPVAQLQSHFGISTVLYRVGIPFLWTPRQVENLRFHELATARIARRNSANKHALSSVSMDAADTGQHIRTSQSFVSSCGPVFSLFLGFSPYHILSGKNGGFLLVSSNVSRHPAVSCLCQSTYTSG